MPQFGPENATLTVHTGRAGVAAKAGHDLVIAVTRWKAELTTGDAPSLSATIDATSLEVVEGVGGVKPLSDSDKQDIVKAINDKVLQTKKFPEITFTSTSVTGPESGPWQIVGELSLVGATAPLSFSAGAGGATEVEVVQSGFGIKPYSALMGTLKVADAVTVRFAANAG